MKKALISLAVVAVALVAAIGVYAHLNAQYPRFANDDNGNVVAVFPISSEGMMEIADGVSFRLDTGSPVSMITPDDVNRLKALGASVTEEWFPSLARDVNGDIYIADKRYRIDMPVINHVLVKDSDGYRYKTAGRRVNTISDMVFLPAADGRTSVIGTDVLERFIVEFRYENNAIALYSNLPGGYKRLTDLHRPKISNRIMGCGGQYYVDITTENNTHRYLVDTGIDDIHIKLPMCDTILVKAPLHESVYSSPRGRIQAKYISEAWVKIGNRAGSHEAYYATDGDEDYAINPLAFFSQDLVIDFRGRAIYVRPHTRLASRH